MNRRAATATTSIVLVSLVSLLVCSACFDQGQDARDGGANGDLADRHASLAAAVADAMSEDDPLERAARLATVLQGFDHEALGEVEQAWLLAAEAVDGSQTIELALIITWWARYDPEGAFSWLHERRRQQNPILLTALVRSWASRAPNAASRAVAALPRRKGQDLSHVIHALAQGWNASGQPGVEAYLIALPSDVNRQIALTGLVVSKVRRSGVEETIRWAEALPDDAAGDFKQLAFRRVAGAIADVDPIRAAAWAESQRDGEWGVGLARSVAQKWSLQAGEASMEWLRGLPDRDSPDIARAFEEAYRAWLNTDREAARAWLREQELDASLDPVVAIYARSTAREDPEAALPWAARVQDATRRDATLERVARAWMHRDPEAARAWLEKGELSEAAVQRVYTAHEKAKTRAAKKRSRKRAAAGS